jgi:hypothetical protein
MPFRAGGYIAPLQEGVLRMPDGSLKVYLGNQLIDYNPDQSGGLFGRIIDATTIAAISYIATPIAGAVARGEMSASHPAVVAEEDQHRFPPGFNRVGTQKRGPRFPPAYLRGQGSYAQRRSYGRSVIRGFRRKYITVI